MAGIYIHIPFCRHKCLYCDFYAVASLTQKDVMVSAICREIELRKDYLENNSIDTIYFGGGTPSVLSVEDVGQILNRLQNQFHISSAVEITVEANPEDLSDEYLYELGRIGVNRLSIGIQSFCDAHLTYFGRHHSAKQAIESVECARMAGFSNISIDLIYGFPGLTQEQWKENVQLAMDLSVEHLSAYQLMVESGSVFYRRQQQGHFTPANEEDSVTHYQLLTNLLRRSGYEHYELSNFCKPGYVSRHNSSYWFGVHYLGLGPSAHSYNGVSRQWNSANNKKYLDGIYTGPLAIELEVLSEVEKYNELMLTRLRTSRGLLRNELDTFSPQIHQLFGERVTAKMALGLIKEVDCGWIIPEDRWLISDGIIADMMLNG